jgi:meso-butanediol dehydrogenase / (S,S)-butanediol dehydrogenase / diacetyl reductase
MRLEGKVAIVTGATKGIGRIIAAALAAEGAKVVVAGRTAKRGEEVAANIRAAGGQAVFVQADVGDEASTRQIVQAAVDEFGSLTTLVNNAAPTHLLQDGRFLADVDLELWDGVLRVALTGSMLMAKFAIPHLAAAGGGTIVNISSDAAVRASAGLAAYCASKAALNALTRSIAVEYAPQNIRANSIQVGQILPPQAIEFVTSDPLMGPKLEAAHRLRLGRREDIAGGVVYLASDEASFVTGTTLVIDGGASAMTNLLASELFPNA